MVVWHDWFFLHCICIHKYEIYFWEKGTECLSHRDHRSVQKRLKERLFQPEILQPHPGPGNPSDNHSFAEAAWSEMTALAHEYGPSSWFYHPGNSSLDCICIATAYVCLVRWFHQYFQHGCIPLVCPLALFDSHIQAVLCAAVIQLCCLTECRRLMESFHFSSFTLFDWSQSIINTTNISITSLHVLMGHVGPFCCTLQLCHGSPYTFWSCVNCSLFLLSMSLFCHLTPQLCLWVVLSTQQWSSYWQYHWSSGS